MANVILADCAKAEVDEFQAELARGTGLDWQVWICRSNWTRKNRILSLIRYVLYFLFPLRVLLSRKRFDGGHIVAWQQFYGILYAVYARLFRCKKRSTLTVMTFIYRPKPGRFHALYFRLMRYALQSGHIDHITCTARAEMELYAKLFDVKAEMFSFVPWGVVDYTGSAPGDEALARRRYVFSPGRSNRDWPFLIESMRGARYPLLIACDELPKAVLGNVEIRNNIGGDEVYRYMKNAYCIVISIDDPEISAGQTVLLHAFSFGIPIVVTESKGLTEDYITHRQNGLIIEKDRQALLDALEELYENKELYETLAENGMSDFYRLYTKGALGRNVAEIITAGADAGRAVWHPL